jgi:hypothetical protein
VGKDTLVPEGGVVKKSLGIWYPDRWVAKKQDRYQEKRRFERLSSAGKFKLNKPKSISVGLRRWTKRRVERTHTKALTLFFAPAACVECL